MRSSTNSPGARTFNLLEVDLKSLPLVRKSVELLIAEKAGPEFAQGYLQGLEDGRRQIVVRMLGHRFGKVPASIVRRLRKASQKEMDHITNHLHDACAITEVMPKQTDKA